VCCSSFFLLFSGFRCLASCLVWCRAQDDDTIMVVENRRKTRRRGELVLARLGFFFNRILVGGVFFFLQDSREKGTDPIVEDEVVVVPDLFNGCFQSRNGQRTVFEEEVLSDIQSLESGRTILAV